jgi:acetyltransferase-like isoleucine patch superfamily enzyme
VNRVVNGIQALPFVPERLRQSILRWSGLKIGIGSKILGQSFFGSGKCVIGDGCFISVQCFFDGYDSITIGDNVYLAMGVKLITSAHHFGGADKRAGAAAKAPVVIGNGCWLGASSLVLPGVVVAPGCIIAAGAVVTKSTAANGLYAGVPARRVRELDG